MISRQLARGDVILKVDGRDAARDPQSLGARLVGNDIPGSLLALQVRKHDGRIHDVLLARMKASDIAAKRRLFEVLALLQQSLSHSEGEGGEAEMSKMIEECCQVWSGIVSRDALVAMQVFILLCLVMLLLPCGSLY